MKERRGENTVSSDLCAASSEKCSVKRDKGEDRRGQAPSASPHGQVGMVRESKDYGVKSNAYSVRE
jgi:hypothetical protein